MTKELQNKRKIVLILIMLGLILIVFGAGLIYEGQRISNELKEIYVACFESTVDPFSAISNVDIGSGILYYIPPEITPFYIRFSWELFFVIPAAVMLLCSFLTLFSAYNIYFRKKQRPASICLNFSIIGVMSMAYLPLSFVTGRLWLITSIELFHIYLLFVIELLAIGILATVCIFLIRERKKKLIVECYSN